MSTAPELCPICGTPDCGGAVYPRMVERYLAGHDRAHWRRIHDRELPASERPSPEDMALRSYLEDRPCCG